MSFATGMSWLKHRRDYELRFGRDVPDWVCTYDLHVRLPLVITALRLGWPKFLCVMSFRMGHGVCGVGNLALPTAGRAG